MKIDLLASLVDTKVLYEALAHLKSKNSEDNLLSQETHNLLLFKIRQTCKEMKTTARYVEERLVELGLDEPKPKPKRRKRQS